MPPMGTKRRAAAACQFCRHRKIKCDGEVPCSNCRAYGRDCTQTESVKRPRPSNSRIAELEEENRRLQDALLRSGSPNHLLTRTENDTRTSVGRAATPNSVHAPVTPARSSLPPVDQTSNQAESTTTDNGADVPRPAALSRMSFTATGEPSYHGPTSALYDDVAATRSVVQRAPSKVSQEWVQRGLMAEAAQQRQLEDINYASGKLDFDGVDPQLGMHLLNLHWNRQHHSFHLTYRPAFMRDMAQGGPYFSKLLLNAIFFGVSKFSSRIDVRHDPDDVRTAGWQFRQRVKTLLGEEMDKSKITTVQALLVMSCSLFALGDEGSAAWLYAGTAYRMIIDLGMHVDAEHLPNLRSLSDEDLEIRRRVFWGAFVVDKLHSLYQGRPVSLQEGDIRVPTTFLDTYEELESWKPFAYPETRSYVGSPSYSVSTFVQLCKLSVIMNRILNKVYAERSSRRSVQELVNDLKSLHQELVQWREDLPGHLTFNPGDTSAIIPPPHVLSLLATQNVLLILLHRPFVADGHLHSKPSSDAVSSFLVCASAATEITNILRAYDTAFSVRRAPYLMSYATYVSATIHVRIAAQREPNSDAHASLSTCLDLLTANSETNWAVRKASVVIRDLMKRMNVVVSADTAAARAAGNANNNSSQDHHSRPETHRQLNPNNDTALSSSADYVPDHNDSWPDIDIDAIIQSFMREGQQAGRQPLQQPLVQQQQYVGHFANGQQQGTFMSPYGTAGMAAGPFEDELFGQTVNDMLFGFNGSIVDMPG